MLTGPYLLAAVLPLAAQQPPAVPEEQPLFRVETNLALVRFHVVRDKKYVTSLKPEDIEILEDNKPQKAAFFESARGPRTVPLEVLLLFDASMSVMNTGLLNAFVFRENLLEGMEQTSLSVYAFNNRLKRFSKPTRDLERLKEAFQGVEQFARGGTRLYDAIAEAARGAASGDATATRIMLVFSDGLDTTRTKPEFAAQAAREAGIPLYPVVLGHGRLVELANQIEQKQRPNRRGMGIGHAKAEGRLDRLRAKEGEILEFAQLGEDTGGRSFDPPAAGSVAISHILTSLVDRVRSEYVAGYYPGPSGPQKKPRRVQVKLRSGESGKLHGGSRVVIR